MYKYVFLFQKFPDYTQLAEEWFSRDGSFEVNEETLYNILSADIKGNSNVDLSGTYKILPAMPKSIAKRLKNPNVSILRMRIYLLVSENFFNSWDYRLCLEILLNPIFLFQKTSSPLNNDSFDSDYSLEKGTSPEPDLPMISGKLCSDDFVDTEDMCRNLMHLRWVYFRSKFLFI